ncbi:MAG: capsule biosynthesis protein [Moorea sp. SIO1F2]|uniref:capsule biosynthesis protein n=1 Tax=unclassified Moorena TaxID=2683338 RepID=UPI0013B7A347|nr:MULTISPECIES: capsule biosynthesis protein [unclassified Moorena]NEO06100.1 capsule biosynthesis protein [Moorena sp. SIO3I8]NET84252.1 capsule biosynthesis protein [Moorena sp. SIO1F2]
MSLTSADELEPSPLLSWQLGQSNLLDWRPVIETNPSLWREAKQRSHQGPQVLMATTVGGLAPLSLPESLLAVALTLRGAEVHTLLCDHSLPACLNLQKLDTPQERIENYDLETIKCQNCFATGGYLYQPLHLTNHVFSELLTGLDRQEAKQIAAHVRLSEIENYCLGNWNIGEHAYAGALRYFTSGNLDNEPKSEIVVRRYFEGALLTAYAISKLLSKYNFKAACFNHGIYLPHGIIGEVCRSRQVRVVNWAIAYRKRCFIFSHGDTYHHTMLSEPLHGWETMPWTEAMTDDILQYLKSRWQGTRDWIWFHEKPDEEFSRNAEEMGLDLNQPVIGMLTNVMWDAQLHYRGLAFPNMLTWVLQTIEYFAKRPDLQLLIRIHPAEIRGTLPSRQPLLPEIKKVWSQLPKNIFIIPPESPVSTYAAMEQCDSVIIYGTKTGVELTSVGIPVIVGGEAWIRDKGITMDPSTAEEYFQCLDQLPLGERLDANALKRARMYAYHFFFRRMIPLQFTEPISENPYVKLNITSLEQLLPGADPGLDIICDGILSGSPFIYPAERLGIDRV